MDVEPRPRASNLSQKNLAESAHRIAAPPDPAMRGPDLRPTSCIPSRMDSATPNARTMTPQTATPGVAIGNGHAAVAAPGAQHDTFEKRMAIEVSVVRELTAVRA